MTDLFVFFYFLFLYEEYIGEAKCSSKEHHTIINTKKVENTRDQRKISSFMPPLNNNISTGPNIFFVTTTLTQIVCPNILLEGEDGLLGLHVSPKVESSLDRRGTLVQEIWQ